MKRLISELSDIERQLLGKTIFSVLDECDRKGRNDLYKYAVLAIYEEFNIECPHQIPNDTLPMPPDKPKNKEYLPCYYEAVYRYYQILNNINYECPICGAIITRG